MTDVLWEVFVWQGPVAADGYGTLLAQVPGWQSLSLSPLGNAVGAGQISLPLDSPIFWQGADTPETTPVLMKETLWQVVQNGTAVFEFLAQSVDRTTVESDETRTVTVSGPGTAQCLNWGVAMPFGWQPVNGGFIGVTGAIQDSFGEQDANGNFEIDTALWNLSTPGACTIPASTASYTQATAPTGTIQVGAVWHDTSTSPVTDYIWDGNFWASSTSFTGSTGGGSVQVALTPAGSWLGGGKFNFSNSSFSCSVSAAQPYNPAAPGCPLDQDPCNGSDATELVITPSGGTGRAVIGLDYQQFFCQYLDKNGNLQTHVIGLGRVGGTGAYDSSWAQYWRVSCDLQASGGTLTRFWTSGDGSSWTLQWAVNEAGSSAWDPSMVNVYMGGTYNTTGGNGAYAQFSSINGEIQANPDNGPIYISTPAMAVVFDQLRRIAARGTVPFISPTFTASTDSDGNTWADTWSLQVPVGTDMLSAQQNYAGAVDAQWYMQPGYNLYTGLNPGRRLQNAIIWHEGEITQSGRTQTRDQIYNVAAAADGSGMIWTEVSAPSVAKWGQRETWTLSGGTIDAQSAVNTAAAAVNQWDDEVDARILQVPPNQDGKTAFIDFTIFDWIGVERSDFSAADAMQVIGITVTIDQDGAETHELIVNTYRQVLAQWFQYLMNKFGGQAASTLGALTPGTTAGSAFTLAVGPNLAVSPAQTGGSGSSKASGISTVASVGQMPEVIAQNSPTPQTPGTGGSGGTSGTTGIIPGSLLVPQSVPQIALAFELPNGSLATFSATAPPSPNVNDLWYDEANGNQLYQWTGTTWQLFQFGAQAVSFSASSIGGITVYVQATAPTGSINASSLWYDSSNNYKLNVYSGSSWTAYQFGTNAISAGSITGALIAAATVAAGNIVAGTITTTQIAASTITGTNIAATTISAANIVANTITAAQIAAATITTTQIHAATITGSNIAATTITAANIAANTITAGQIAAGTITGTQIAASISLTSPSITGGTITGGMIIADGSSGQILVYSGTPASGNLIGAWSGASGSDGFSNSYVAGLSAYALQLFGTTSPGTPPADSTYLYSSTSGVLNVVLASSFAGVLTVSHCNITEYDNNTSGSYHRVSTTWNIPANDAQVGTCYRLKCRGYASNTAAHSLYWNFVAFGTNVIVELSGSAFASAPTNLYWMAECEAAMITTGSSGSVIMGINVTATIAPLGFTNVTSWSGCSTSNAVTTDTTSAQTAELDMQWDSGTSSIKGFFSTFDRTGA